MLRTTTWHPDTCDCIVEYEWDDEAAPDVRTHTITKSVRKCKRHADVPDAAGHHAVLFDENPRKNKVLDHLLHNAPGLTKKDDKGRDHIDESKVSWSFDADGKLRVACTGLNAGQKNALQATLGAKHGNSKVAID